MTSSWFFLSTLNYDARSTTHQIKRVLVPTLICMMLPANILSVKIAIELLTHISFFTFIMNGAVLVSQTLVKAAGAVYNLPLGHQRESSCISTVSMYTIIGLINCQTQLSGG